MKRILHQIILKIKTIFLFSKDCTKLISLIHGNSFVKTICLQMLIGTVGVLDISEY